MPRSDLTIFWTGQNSKRRAAVGYGVRETGQLPQENRPRGEKYAPRGRSHMFSMSLISAFTLRAARLVFFAA